MSERFTNPLLQMTFAGHRDVFPALKRQAQSLDRKERIIVIIPGGGQQGIFPTGVAQAIHESKLTSGIHTIVCASAGAGTGWFLIAGEEKAGDIFTKRNPDNEMIKVGRGRPLLDNRTLATMFRDDYPVDPELIRQSKTRLLVGLTSWNTGEEVMIDAGKLKNPLSAVVGTMLLPFISGFPSPVVKIDGVRYCDGGLPNPLPIDKALEQDPTHILVLALQPLEYRIPHIPGFKTALTRLTRAGLLPKVCELLAAFPEKVNQGYDQLLQDLEGDAQVNGVKIATIAPTVFISPLSMNRKELYKGQENARIFAHHLIKSN